MGRVVEGTLTLLPENNKGVPLWLVGCFKVYVMERALAFRKPGLDPFN